MRYKMICAAASAAVLLSGCGSRTEISAASAADSSVSLPAKTPEPSRSSAPQASAPPASSSAFVYTPPPDYVQIADKVILVGDSRTFQLGVDVLGLSPEEDDPRCVFDSTADGDVFIGAIGEGCKWLYENTERIESYITDNSALVVNIGVNGAPDSHYEIAQWCGNEAEKFKDRGVKVYFMSVNPINSKLADKYGYIIDNNDVIAFNLQIMRELSDDVEYLDTYLFIEEDILGPDCGTPDGVHYDDYVSLKIMDYTWKKVKWRKDEGE